MIFHLVFISLNHDILVSISYCTSIHTRGEHIFRDESILRTQVILPVAGTTGMGDLPPDVASDVDLDHSVSSESKPHPPQAVTYPRNPTPAKLRGF